MTRITNAEQVLVLLRAHLERAQRSNRKRTQSRAKPGPLERVQRLASAEGLSEADVARALIAGLLTEEFGASFAAEPRFQAVVEDVWGMIERDEKARGVMRMALAELVAGEDGG
jgi:hypothetical protein